MSSLTPPRRAALVALLLPVIVAPGAHAQVTVTPYAATDRALPTTPEVYGLAITSWAGALGIRASGALGDLRTELSDSTRKMIAAELPKDLTRHAEGDLPQHLESVLAV